MYHRLERVGHKQSGRFVARHNFVVALVDVATCWQRPTDRELLRDKIGKEAERTLHRSSWASFWNKVFLMSYCIQATLITEGYAMSYHTLDDAQTIASTHKLIVN